MATRLLRRRRFQTDGCILTLRRKQADCTNGYNFMYKAYLCAQNLNLNEATADIIKHYYDGACRTNSNADATLSHLPPWR